MSKRHVGERVLQKCGEYAEIIELLPNNRCIIKFDSGVVKNASRVYFARGGVNNKSRGKTDHYIGERKAQRDNSMAEIIELLPNSRCVVRFDNGVEKEVARSSFASGGLSDRQPVSHARYVGERKKQRCGMYAVVVELLPKNMCRVRFTNGYEKVCLNREFGSGTVALYESRAKSKRYVGEKVVQNNGNTAELIELLEGNKCRVRFEDGFELVRNREQFASGGIKHTLMSKVTRPLGNKINRCIGERILLNNGEYIEIVEILRENKYKIMFDNGDTKVVSKTVLESKNIEPVSGKPSLRCKIGETVYQECGMNATIISLLPKFRCVVRFENGDENIVNRSMFKRGSIKTTTAKPKKVHESVYKLDYMVTQKHWGNARIIDLLPDLRCIIQYANGHEANCRCASFSKGEARNSVSHKVTIGSCRYQVCGAYATITKLLSVNNCICTFDSGVEVETKVSLFADGRVSEHMLKEDIIIEKGIKASITSLLMHGRLQVTYEDGEEGTVYRSKVIGGITQDGDAYVRVGDKIMQADGLVAECVEIYPFYRCVVKFESGMKMVIDRNTFKHGLIRL